MKRSFHQLSSPSPWCRRFSLSPLLVIDGLPSLQGMFVHIRRRATQVRGISFALTWQKPSLTICDTRYTLPARLPSRLRSHSWMCVIASRTHRSSRQKNTDLHVSVVVTSPSHRKQQPPYPQDIVQPNCHKGKAKTRKSGPKMVVGDLGVLLPFSRACHISNEGQSA